MRMSTKGGVTPRDRRLDRGKVATAALAALFFATIARANVVEFQVDPLQSSLTQTLVLNGPAVGGQAVGAPQYAGSDTTSFFGRMWVDIQPTTIQLLTGSSVSANVGAPGAGGVPGLYSPFDPVFTDPNPSNPGVNPNSNYGLSIPAISLLAEQYNIRLDMGYTGFPSLPLPLSGNNFNLAGQAMTFTDGRQAFVSALGNSSDSLIGNPLLFFGSANFDIGTWDGTTLTLPVHSTYSFTVTTNFGGISEDVNVQGQLVLTPVVPEPATLTLFGLGVAGLFSYAWRARKRKA